MTPGIYSTVSALTARWTEQEKASENLSGSNTVGHKRQVISYGSFDKVLHSANGSQQTIAEPLSYARATVSDWTDGVQRQTGNKLDAAINGNGFFQVQTPSGPRLTRDGHFSINPNTKQLVNDAGYPVLGTHGPITVLGDTRLDGTGKVISKGKTVDTLALIAVDRTENIQPAGPDLYVVADASKKPFTGTITPGSLEMSNVNTPSEMASMIQNQRMYDMLTRAFQAQDEGLGKAIQDLAGS